MKEMNRREFLTLTGAAVVALSLAGCGGGPSAPPAPTTSKEADLVAAINKVWKKKYEAKAVVHEQLTLNQDAVGMIKGYGRVFENAKETPHQLTDADTDILSDETGKLPDEVKMYGEAAGMAGFSGPDTKGMVALEYEYSCDGATVLAFVEELLTNPNSFKAEFISIYLPVVKNVTYMTAVVFRINKP